MSREAKPVKLDSLFAVIKMARNMTSYKHLLAPGCRPPPTSKDTVFQYAVKKIMGANALVESLTSLDRKQMEVASDNARILCERGPARAMVLHDAGCIPVMVDLLALEGLKNTKIVANSLFSLNILALEISCAQELANCAPLSKNLETLYRTENKVYQQFTASIVCRIFSQLSNIGRESNLVLGVKDRRRGSRYDFPARLQPFSYLLTNTLSFRSMSVSSELQPTPEGGVAGAARDGGLLGLLVRLLDSNNSNTLLQALSTIETLTYHFDNVVALCQLNEPNLLKGLVKCLRMSDVEIVMKAAQCVSGIVCNSRLHSSVLRYARNGDLLGQLRATMDAFSDDGNEDKQTAMLIAKECVHDCMFDMYCSLPKDRKRYHGPESRREDTLQKEANR
jgi:hypothetical protein